MELSTPSFVLASSSQESNSSVEEPEKVVGDHNEQRQSWSGCLEWFGESEDGEKNTKEPKELPCVIWETIPDESGILDPEPNPEKTNKLDTWGSKLVVHLMPKADFRKMETDYIRDTKQVSLSFENTPSRVSFLKLMKAGRYAGCVHIPSEETNDDDDGRQLTNNMKVMLLLYSRGKQSVIGFIPNDQNGFVNRLLEIVPDHLIFQEQSTKIKDSINVTDHSTNLSQESQDIETINEQNDLMDTNQETETVVNNFWVYDLPLEFQPIKYLVQTSPTEFKQNLNTRKTAHFLKGVKWAPDGSCLISNSDDDVLRLFNVPESFHTVPDWKNHSQDSSLDNEETPSLESVVRVKEGGQVYDYCWYPLMSSYDPVSSCFLTTSADSPVHLWDAFTGKLRASYLSYNQVDEVTAARTVSFDPSGEYIHCGFDTMIRTFNITRPGRQCSERKLKHSTINELNQPGIVSSIAVNPSVQSLMAIGSYLKTVGLYNSEDSSVICILEGHLGGVTHLKFSHDGTKLFSGGRKDSRLICWDLRYMGEQYKIYDRVVTTQQRIYFDITPNDKYLITGGTDGYVKMWDMSKEDTNPIIFRSNSDCVNGISINPFIPILATASGQRHCYKPANSSEDEDEEMQISSSKRQEERDIKLWKLC